MKPADIMQASVFIILFDPPQVPGDETTGLAVRFP
jgi:hypothetical protein